MEEIIRPENCTQQSDYIHFVKEMNHSMNNDIEGSLSTALTLKVMNICKVKIIGPFNIMLTMVGWRSLVTQLQFADKYPRLIRIIDKVILVLFLFLLIFSYVYQVLVCRFSSDEKIMTVGPTLTTSSTPHNTTTSSSWMEIRPMLTIKNVSDNFEVYILCNHYYTTSIIPNILHFVAYVFGMIHYRFNENEDIYGLMEKTLQYSTTLGTRRNDYLKVTRMLTMWMVMAAFWVLLAVVNHIFYDITFNAYASKYYIFKINPSDNDSTSNIKHFLFILDFVGYTIGCVVTAAIVLNYTIYCELVKFYVDAISKKIEMRCIKLNMIKSDIQNVSGTISLINGMIGRMVTLIFILKLNIFIVGINNLMISESKNPWEIAYKFYFVLHIIPLILTALVQCVRVNSATKSFKRWGRHMSVFGYRKETRKQLDSFLLFTMGFNSKARLMALPLDWWQLLLFFIIVGFILITLIQTGIMDNVALLKTF